MGKWNCGRRKTGGGGGKKKTASARFQASAAMLLRPSFFWGVMQRTLVVVHRRFGTKYRVLSPTVNQSKSNAGQRVDSLLYGGWCERRLDLRKVKKQFRLPRPGSNFTLQQRGWPSYLPKKPIPICCIMDQPGARRFLRLFDPWSWVPKRR